MEKIISDNELKDPENLVVGQTIVVLKGPAEHTVKRGETLYIIAKNYNVTVDDILKANPDIEDPASIQVGQVINIPEVRGRFGTILVNGYAYPGAKMEYLQKTFPYLTYLSIFGYKIKADGTLDTINDDPLIKAARKAHVAPMMVITNIREGGGFSSELAHTVLNSEALQDKLIDNVISLLKSKNYYGLDVDFEYIYPEDREKYNNFLRKARGRIEPLGYTLSTAIAPKISEGQPGLLYEAHDYKVHGEVADHVIIMTYEWGYTYGPPMAVSPVNQVKKVLNYAVSVIPSEKILMGMPNYGYDWKLPYQSGTAARNISNTGAVALAKKFKAAIKYDIKSQAPYFNYFDEAGQEHVVWFDDARSTEARLKLVKEYDLGGVSYWTISPFFPQNWLVFRSMYNTAKVL